MPRQKKRPERQSTEQQRELLGLRREITSATVCEALESAVARAETRYELKATVAAAKRVASGAGEDIAVRTADFVRACTAYQMQCFQYIYKDFYSNEYNRNELRQAKPIRAALKTLYARVSTCNETERDSIRAQIERLEVRLRLCLDRYIVVSKYNERDILKCIYLDTLNLLSETQLRYHQTGFFVNFVLEILPLISGAQPTAITVKRRMIEVMKELAQSGRGSLPTRARRVSASVAKEDRDVRIAFVDGDKELSERLQAEWVAEQQALERRGDPMSWIRRAQREGAVLAARERLDPKDFRDLLQLASTETAFLQGLLDRNLHALLLESGFVPRKVSREAQALSAFTRNGGEAL